MAVSHGVRVKWCVSAIPRQIRVSSDSGVRLCAPTEPDRVGKRSDEPQLTGLVRSNRELAKYRDRCRVWRNTGPGRRRRAGQVRVLSLAPATTMPVSVQS